MFNIVENPETKELFFVGQSSIYDFDGTPYRNLDTTGWKVISQAPSLGEWYKNPGNYRTYYGTMQVRILDNDRWINIRMGETISYLRNWLQDARENNTAISIGIEKAYSDRNVAKSKDELL